MRKYISLTITALVLAVSIVTGVCILAIPTASDDMTTFSATNALKHLETIAAEPHSVFDSEAHEKVRLYIKDALTEMGLDVEEHNWAAEETDFMGAINADGTLDKTKPIEYDIKNLWVEIPGKSQTGVLLMAHYDSRGHASRPGEVPGSYGAGDDGFGVVTLLEIARLFADSNANELETSIYLCFTDAEETGMFGALMEAQNNEIVKNNVNFVINVEARGVKGPAYMFESSKNNGKVIELYNKASLPMTYSVATAVYSVMTNFTDFTTMLEIGKAGINFSTLDNINYYHVPEDNLSNIDVNSIQHYGEQILPIINEYTSDAKYADMNYFDDTQDAVFFNILPGVLAVYSETTAVVLAIVAVVAFLLAVILLKVKGLLSIRKMLLALAIIFGTIVVSAVLGFGISYLTALIAGTTWNLTGLRAFNAGIPFAVAFVIVLAVELFYCFKKFKSVNVTVNHLTAGVLINLIFAVLTTFVLAGTSFMFLWTALLGAVVLIVRALTGNCVINHILCSVANAVAMLIFVPLLYSLFIAVTLGGLLALTLIFAFMLSVVLPTSFVQARLGAAD